MSDLDFKPLAHSGSDQLVRIVLRSARADGPSASAKEQMLAPLDRETPLSSSGAKPAASFWHGVGGRSLGIGLALVIGVSVAVTRTHVETAEHAATPNPALGLEVTPRTTGPIALAASPAPPAETRSAFERTVQPATPAEGQPPSQQGVATLPPKERVARPVAKPHTQREALEQNGSRPARAAPPALTAADDDELPASSTLSRETARVGAARSALASGDAARTLQLLDTYDADFPGGAFSVEVSVLRIEALARSGRVDEARELGDRFLAQLPRGAFARRVAATLRNIAPVHQDPAVPLPHH